MVPNYRAIDRGIDSFDIELLSQKAAFGGHGILRPANFEILYTTYHAGNQKQV